MMTKQHKSKISYGILAFLTVLLLAPIIPIIAEGVMDKGIAMKLLVMLALYVFVLHVFLQTTYTIDEGKLKIKSGLMSYRPIEIAEIREIAKTKSLWSSPAPSLDRIVIKYGSNRSIILSPQDKVTFAKDLCEINPNIVNLITEN